MLIVLWKIHTSTSESIFSFELPIYCYRCCQNRLSCLSPPHFIQRPNAQLNNLNALLLTHKKYLLLHLFLSLHWFQHIFKSTPCYYNTMKANPWHLLGSSLYPAPQKKYMRKKCYSFSVFTIRKKIPQYF